MKIANFRDLGGIKTTDGRRVKNKRLLRSAELVNVDKVDSRLLLEEYQLKQIVDFRRNEERLTRPNDEFHDVTCVPIDVMAEHQGSFLDIDEMTKDFGAEEAVLFMKEMNRSFVLSPSANVGYGRFLKACLNIQEGATLFHCAFGKDRTGFGAALLLKILGVPDENIFSDYLQTMESLKESNKNFLISCEKKGINGRQLDAMHSIIAVRKDYLEAAFQSIQQHYGDFRNYLNHALGIHDVEVKRLRELYLED